MRSKLVIVIAVMSALAAACSGSDADPTTSSPATTSATTTTAPATTTTTTLAGGLVELEPNGEAFLRQGDAGPYSFALQYYLACNGLEELWEGGPQLTVDGSYGPITADAVAIAQAQRRRIPTGDTDAFLFGSLARSCDQERALVFPDGGSTLQAAGSAAPGDDEVFVLAGTEGQTVTISVVEGEVGYRVEGVDGTVVKTESEPDNWTGTLPTTQNYRVRVVATAEAPFLLSLELPPPPLVDIDFGPMRLAPGGLGVVDFGEEPDAAVEVLTFVLGEPTDDTGWIVGADPDRPSCRGANRHVTWVIQEAAPTGGDEDPGEPIAVLEADFSDVLTGQREFAQYTYRSALPELVDSGARGLATVEGITIGSTVDQYVAAYGEPDWIEEDLGIARFAGAMVAFLERGDQATDDAGRVLRVLAIGAGEDGCADTG